MKSSSLGVRFGRLCTKQMTAATSGEVLAGEGWEKFGLFIYLFLGENVVMASLFPLRAACEPSFPPLSWIHVFIVTGCILFPQIPMLKSQSPVLQNVTVLADKTIKEAIKSK